ncbi:four and a half lim domains protein [Anaeramoeba flamelloides]|uniref:Four and a half lim domains protein n=1 Tax=Anaeramoeba flamelloides TaxID=1746091 RepID=A0ABQ8XDX4_9EUKA|nr:four and a half lim domains protein [Anaeramoeba flamelloides]
MSKCPTCNRTVYKNEAVIGPCDKNYHKRCFKCAGCKNKLTPGRFKSSDGEPYCNGCFSRVQGTYRTGVRSNRESGKRVENRNLSNTKTCFICNKKVFRVQLLDEKPIHAGCFTCKHCHKKLSLTDYQKDKSKFHLEGNKFYHLSCFNFLNRKNTSTNKSSTTNKSLSSNKPSTTYKSSNTYQPKTNVRKFQSSSRYGSNKSTTSNYNTKPTNTNTNTSTNTNTDIKKTYSSIAETLEDFPNCQTCTKPIKDTILRINNLNYHLDCIKCTRCRKEIFNQSFWTQNNSFLCLECHN